nr:MAG TPA: hypothetical protein [Caudoviricetes sp.]
MKKLLVALGMATMLAMPVVFANDFVVEPETDTSVSYAAYDVLSGEWETTFVNYCNANGQDEYWLRLAFRGRQSKVLHYCTLDVDGEQYRLTAVPFDSKHFYAAQSVTVTMAKPGSLIGDFGMLLVSHPRYYAIPTEVANKLMTAKKVVLTVNRVHRLNTQLTVNNKMLNDLHRAYSLRYADFNNVWQPKDTAKDK